MPSRVRIERAPSVPRQSYEVAKEVARALDLPLADARGLLARAPLTLPRGFDESEAMGLAQRVSSLGGSARVVTTVVQGGESCQAHPRLDGAELCRSCEAQLCVACAARPNPSGTPLCASCALVAVKKKRGYRMRLALWLVLLTAVCLYGLRELRRRRPDWNEPRRVAFVLVTTTDERIDPLAVDGFKQRVPALEARLREEAAKYLPRPARPFELSVFGPVRRDERIPKLEGDSFVSLARFNFDLWRFARRIDDTGNIDSGAYDVRVYVNVRAPAHADLQTVEGASQDGGSIGLVELELAPDSVDFGLFVAAHELLHTRGASDKYGPDGLALRPIGYAEPARVPLYPQLGAEVMARGRPLSPTLEAPPDSLDELTVGEGTAREIGWLGED